MANLQPRRDKSGKLVSYSIRVFRGRGADGKQLKPWTATFDVAPTWSEKTARKKAEAFAATFEKQCKDGLTSDGRRKFTAYCDYVIELKEQRGAKHSTIVRYRELTERIYPAIGHIKLCDLRPDHLNSLYTELLKPGGAKSRTWARSKTDLAAVLKELGLSRVKLAEQCGLPLNKVYAAVKGQRVGRDDAAVVAGKLDLKLEDAFMLMSETRTLSPKTVLEHHRLISAVLEQAVKEGLVAVNVASRATLPKVEHKEVNYFQPEQIAAIREALEHEPLKWKTLVHLLLITGARRGEVLGLKWDNVDFENNRVYICNSVLYSADVGVYESTPKTEKSKRYIYLPRETMELLREYRAWQSTERERLEGYYLDRGFVFAQDSGAPMHPDSVTDYLKKLSRRYGLPHLNAHAFRHTMASMLYYSGVDSVSISKRLGHAQVSTTSNIYAHVIESADRQNADILARALLQTGSK